VTDQSRLVLEDAWRQCERHLHHLKHALASLSALLPVTPHSLSLMDDEMVQDWDQFVLRFTKLQDAIGARLLPAVLSFLQEPYEDRPMLDKLHRLEKLGYLPNVESWNTLRSIRNHFAHDYPQDDALKAAYLNEAVSAVPQMEALLAKITPLMNAN
jgi:hypothetical protein